MSDIPIALGSSVAASNEHDFIFSFVSYGSRAMSLWHLPLPDKYSYLIIYLFIISFFFKNGRRTI